MTNLTRKVSLVARTFRHDQDGGVAIMFAAGLMMLIGVAAAAVDLSYLYVLKGKLQVTADAAALAGGPSMADEDAARDRAQTYALMNMPPAHHGTVLADGDVQTGTWHFRDKAFTPGAAPVNALRVITRRTAGNGNEVGLFFAQAMGFEAADVDSQAIVAELILNPPCVMALNQSATAAVKVNNGTVIADGCGFHVNSDAEGALDIANGGVMEGDSICVRGSVTGVGDSNPSPQTGCPKMTDPLANMVPPDTSQPCDYNNVHHSNGTHVLSPGTYCGGISLTSSAEVDFLPGEYIIKGGKLSTSGGSTSIDGDEVMFYFTDGAEVDTTGQGHLDLSAPTSGTYKGILFYGDPNSGPDIRHKIAGNGDMTYDGTMYFPNDDLEVVGNGAGSTAAGNTVVIADTLTFSGNGSLNFKYDPAADVPLPDELAALSTETIFKLVN